MTSRSADWVFGLARLISSASTMFAKIGPAWNSNTPSFWSYTLMPVMSPGSRSGVNWMRVLVPWTDCARARASEVLPVPGTSSSSTWPSLSIAVSTSSTTCRLPSTARSTLSAICENVWANHVACSCVRVMDAVLLGARNGTSSGGRGGLGGRRGVVRRAHGAEARGGVVEAPALRGPADRHADAVDAHGAPRHIPRVGRVRHDSAVLVVVREAAVA